METKQQASVLCRQCRKEIKTEVIKCVPCVKLFHPSCHKQHKVYNTENELVPCNGKMERCIVKSGMSTESDGASSDSNKMVKQTAGEGGRNTKERGGSLSDNVLEDKVNIIYKMMNEIRDETVIKNVIKKTVLEARREEMNKFKQEVINWKVNELEPFVSAIVKREMQNTTKWNDKETMGRMSYSESVGRKEKGEAVLIIKPINEEEKSSELTKNDIKN